MFLFLSSSSLPRNLIEQDWFRTIATYNPVSYLFEGLRSLVIFGWDGEALALGFGIAVVIARRSAWSARPSALRDAAGAHMRRFADVARRRGLAQRCTASSPTRSCCCRR